MPEPHCGCTTERRCAIAHQYRDARLRATTLAERQAITTTYTAHLHQAGLLEYPTTAAPVWRCADACDPHEPCRQGVTGVAQTQKERLV